VQLCLLLLKDLNIHHRTITENLLRAVQKLLLPSSNLDRVKPIALTELTQGLALLERIQNHLRL
jgi:hypothetical protein